ncbi:efflux RND transporter periplasmic adaptor subunit [Amphiplicatus metriothermophilus]|uniref:RND family efflux transporter, MFP subunit n=1 Tax=Amphiplicatus metriothermophilus TaxID=1519374 RepID=A0A239PWT8_9PROT|nr:efflux RND transporter periplasmic adaptor subunit [Amphiplicatus metriothermophilus]MBB5519886.1 RND family efflux transporter MFP subunit [Amphiplicatus metriothermophilus]SNT74789.1 RND family efflux transporter, MFP subunit [Amphiplicatus metriothermophilus]
MIRKLATIFGTLGIFAVGFFLIGLMGSLRPKPERVEPEIAPPTVFYEIVEPRTVTLDVIAQGEVRPRTDITLTAQVSGRIVETSPKFLDGGAFEKGDLLLKIEDADYRYALASAKARVAQAEEALRREEAEAALARRDYEELGEGDPSALALRLPQLAQARAAFEAAQAEYQAAELNLARTAVKAPFKGRVRQRLVGEGQFVTVGSQLGRIFSTEIAEVRLPLTDSELAKLGLPIGFVESENEPGPRVELTAEVGGDVHVWEGRIARTEGAIDPGTRQIGAIAVVDDPYGAGAAEDGTPLAAGLFVTARIEGRPYDDAIVLPRSALYGRDTIYLIGENDRLEKRIVKVIDAARDTITVANGLQPGDRVAISPLRGAEEGDAVAPMDPDAVGDEQEEGEPLPPVAENAARRGRL